MKNVTAFFNMIVLCLAVIYPLSGQAVGDTVADFTYKDLEGNDVSLSDFKGKVVFLFLFGNGCPFCTAIGNDTETKVQEEYGARDDFQALGLDLWNGSSSVSTVNAFKQKTGITYPLLLQAGDFSTTYSINYDRLMVLDQQHVIRHKGQTNTANDLDNAIQVIEEYLALTSDEKMVSQAVYSLGQNYPNPATGNTTIKYTLEKPGNVSLKLYNTIGEEVLRMVEEYKVAGPHDQQMNLEGLAPGIYFYQLNVNDYSAVMKLIISTL